MPFPAGGIGEPVPEKFGAGFLLPGNRRKCSCGSSVLKRRSAFLNPEAITSERQQTEN